MLSLRPPLAPFRNHIHQRTEREAFEAELRQVHRYPFSPNQNGQAFATR
jgi:hypothetical protein